MNVVEGENETWYGLLLNSLIKFHLGGLQASMFGMIYEHKRKYDYNQYFFIFTMYPAHSRLGKGNLGT